MRVCFVTLDFPPFRTSGLTIYAEQVVQGLAARGHRVTVVASQRPESRQTGSVALPAGVSVVRLAVGPTDWIGLGWQAARYLRSRGGDFDVVHFANVHFAYAYRGPFIASAFQSFRQQLTSHHGGPYYTNWRNHLWRRVYYQAALWALERPTVRRARHIIPGRIRCDAVQDFLQCALTFADDSAVDLRPGDRLLRIAGSVRPAGD